MNALYSYQQYERENAQLKLQSQKRLLLLLGVLALAVILIGALVTWFQFHRLQMKQKLARVQRLLREHMEKEVEQEQKAQMDALIKNSVLMKHLQESLDAEKPLTDEDVKDIEVLLDDVNPDFLPMLKQLGEMTDIEYQVSLLIRLGMSPIQISSLVLRDKSSVSAIRRRLYKHGAEWQSSRLG